MLYLGSELLASFKDGETACESGRKFFGVVLTIGFELSVHMACFLSVLQKIIFEDNSIHPDCQTDVVKAFQELEQYSVE